MIGNTEQKRNMPCPSLHFHPPTCARSCSPLRSSDCSKSFWWTSQCAQDKYFNPLALRSHFSLRGTSGSTSRPNSSMEDSGIKARHQFSVLSFRKLKKKNSAHLVVPKFARRVCPSTANPSTASWSKFTWTLWKKNHGSSWWPEWQHALPQASRRSSTWDDWVGKECHYSILYTIYLCPLFL